MNIIISNASMIPIYEQITGQIKAMIMDGRLLEETPLPSVRTLSADLKISALTVRTFYWKKKEKKWSPNLNRPFRTDENAA